MVAQLVFEVTQQVHSHTLLLHVVGLYVATMKERVSCTESEGRTCRHLLEENCNNLTDISIDIQHV